MTIDEGTGLFYNRKIRKEDAGHHGTLCENRRVFPDTTENTAGTDTETGGKYE